jgi:hypothetical protein
MNIAFLKWEKDNINTIQNNKKTIYDGKNYNILYAV